MVLDTIDKDLLMKIKTRPGQAVYEVLKSLAGIRTEKTYRSRLNSLAACGFVRLDRTTQHRRVFCYLTDAGEKALAETEPCTPFS